MTSYLWLALPLIVPLSVLVFSIWRAYRDDHASAPQTPVPGTPGAPYRNASPAAEPVAAATDAVEESLPPTVEEVFPWSGAPPKSGSGMFAVTCPYCGARFRQMRNPICRKGCTDGGGPYSSGGAHFHMACDPRTHVRKVGCGSRWIMLAKPRVKTDGGAP